MKEKIQSKVLEIRNLTDTTYVLRLERNGFEFKAGQYLVLNVPGEHKAREYSIYSAETDNFIELLIKEIDEGEVSKELKYLKVGTMVQISGPFGFFILSDDVLEKNQPVIFVATGTGVSPFHSIIRSNPRLDYALVMGVRYEHEAYEKEHFQPERYQLCVSRGGSNAFHGRVTDYLENESINTRALYYLCGNSAMVDQVTDMLEQKGLHKSQIKTEIFF
jgi:ferredoxin--NADP+ reductase/benzoate/toluate 1,2-dioxygenase reductase subunit